MDFPMVVLNFKNSIFGGNHLSRESRENLCERFRVDLFRIFFALPAPEGPQIWGYIFCTIVLKNILVLRPIPKQNHRVWRHLGE